MAADAHSGNNPAAGIPATSTAAPSPPPSQRTGLQPAPLIAVLGIGLIVAGFLAMIPIFLIIGLIVLIVGLVLMATGRSARARRAADVSGTPKPTQAADSTNRQLKVAFAIAIVLVIVVVAISRIGIPYWQHSIYPRFFEKGSSASSSGSPGSRQSQSPFYQEGYDSGTSGLARKGYGFNMYNTGATVAEMEHQACADAINNESNLSSIQDSDHPANQDDYMRGCLDAFHDHPPTGKPKAGPLNPYR